MSLSSVWAEGGKQVVENPSPSFKCAILRNMFVPSCRIDPVIISAAFHFMKKENPDMGQSCLGKSLLL